MTRDPRIDANIATFDKPTKSADCANPIRNA